jgi:hypothetical protein
MRRGTAAALVTLAACLGAPPAALAGGPAVRARSCVPNGARVLARGSAIRIYETRSRSAAQPRSVLACMSGHSGHMTLLAPTRLNLHISLGRFELAGHVAAYLATQFGVDSGTTKLVVVDVGARRVLRSIEAGSYVDAGLIFREAVIRYVVSSRGSVAWTVTREDHREPPLDSVWAAPREGPAALLDSGPAIDAGSLALSGATLSWTDAGAPRTAPMP